MYLRKVTLENIRALRHFEMEFAAGKEAGWHVLIGDNGSGKSSIVKATALALLGADDARSVNLVTKLSSWVSANEQVARMIVEIVREDEFDKPAYAANKIASSEVILSVNGDKKAKIDGKVAPANALWGETALSGWFFAAYGPSRKLKGDASVLAELSDSRSKIAASITAFNDSIALPKLVSWLKDLGLDSAKKKNEKEKLKFIIKFINDSKLLPNDSILLNEIDSEGIWLQRKDGIRVTMDDSSDGYRAILSLTLDILRYLIEMYGIKKIMENNNNGKIKNIPGIILIDEIDAHLHPQWQTRIGQWFTEHFPNMQFIVTTHSPLICRGCADAQGNPRGTIWKLPKAGTGEVKPLTGTAWEQLVYGDVLDAYDTDAFGENVTRGEAGKFLRRKYRDLTYKINYGVEMTAEEKEEYAHLKRIFSSYAETEA